MTVFADAFALIAWLNPRDELHAVVAEYLERFTGRLVTTEWVLMELADALSSPTARETVVAFLRGSMPILCSTWLVTTPLFIKPSLNYSPLGLTKLGR
jgi:predicted nucleic acid-binding protein